MARYTAASIFAAAIICVGCASTPSADKQESVEEKAPSTEEQAVVEIASSPQPEWVAGDITEYPRVHYITSRTQAMSTEEASQQALANIAKFFLVDTNEFDMSIQQAADAAGYEHNTTHLPESAQTVAAPEVARVLAKIEIVDQWFDSETNTYHALTAMPRNTSKGYLQTQIESLDEKTREYMKAARSSPDPFAQAGQIAMAWRCQQLRSKMQKSMQLADLTGRGIKPEFNINLMKQDANNLLTTLQIEPAGLEGEMNAQQVVTMIKGGLLTSDLKPTETNADYIMRGTLEAAVIGERNGWALGHGKLKLVLSDKTTGEVRGSTLWEVEVPGLDENAAIRRVYEKTEYKLKKDMRNILMEMAMQ